MANLIDLIADTFPATDDTGVPLRTTLSMTLTGVDYDEDSLLEGLFLQGPDTDQYTGPGMELLTFPDNVSSNSLDDFLQSPGYYGIVDGTVTVSGIAGNTEVRFDATKPLAPLTSYTLQLGYVLRADAETTVSGIATVDFETGSGSIVEVPSTISTSVLTSVPTSSTPTATTALSVSTTSPVDRSVENSIELTEIDVTFNKNIDATSINSDSIVIKTTPASDHPTLGVNSQGDLVKSIEVNGKVLKLKI